MMRIVGMDYETISLLMSERVDHCNSVTEPAYLIDWVARGTTRRASCDYAK